MPTITCPYCGEAGHPIKASFCRLCGEKIREGKVDPIQEIPPACWYQIGNLSPGRSLLSYLLFFVAILLGTWIFVGGVPAQRAAAEPRSSDHALRPGSMEEMFYRAAQEYKAANKGEGRPQEPSSCESKMPPVKQPTLTDTVINQVMMEQKVLDTSGRWFRDDTHALKLWLPDGWVQVPDNVVRQAYPDAGGITSFVVFQRAGQSRLGYPHVSVGTIVGHQQTRSEIVRGIADFKTSILNIPGASLVDSYRENLCTFRAEFRTDRPGQKSETALVGIHQGRNAVVSIFWNTWTDWSSADKPVFDLIEHSFQFDPGAAYDEALNQPPTPPPSPEKGRADGAWGGVP